MPQLIDFSKVLVGITAWKVSIIQRFFWSVFSCIRAEYRKIQSEYRKMRTRKNSVFGHFSRSTFPLLVSTIPSPCYPYSWLIFKAQMHLIAYKLHKQTHVYFLTKVLKFFNEVIKNQFGKCLKHIIVLEVILITDFFNIVSFSIMLLIFGILKNDRKVIILCSKQLYIVKSKSISVAL